MSDIVRKIQMLLRKTPANGATEAEAENAMLMAQKLMIQHGLTDDDVQEREYGAGASAPQVKKEAYKKPITNYMKVQWYHWRLASVIVDNFRCFYWTEGHWRMEKTARRIIFLGLKEDTEIANDVYQFALRVMENLSKNYVAEQTNPSIRNKLRNVYMEGFINGLKEKFKKQVEENNFQLALAKDEIVLFEYDKANITEGRSASFGTVGGDIGKDAREAGFQAGKNLNYGSKLLK